MRSGLFKILPFFPLLFMLLSACEQEIDINLDNVEPKIVIEGWVNDLPGPYQVKVTRTFDYFSEGDEIMVSGASIVIKDDLGNADTLVEVTPGIYETGHLQGQQMHNYYMEAEIEGNTYTAENYLPRVNPFLVTSYFFSDTIIFGVGYYPAFVALEAPGVGDFYQFRIYKNDSLYNAPSDLLITDDRFVDGGTAPFVYPYPMELGDTVVMEARGISNLTYDLYITLYQQAAGGGPFGSPPNNLITNITGGGLGFFGTAAVTRDTIIIQ